MLKQFTEKQGEEISDLIADLSYFSRKNAFHKRCYDGKNSVMFMLSSDHQMANDQTGWIRKAVNYYTNAIVFQGFSNDKFLSRVYKKYKLQRKSSIAAKNAIIYGVGFILVSAGGDGENPLVISSIDPSHVACNYDDRNDVVKSAIIMDNDFFYGPYPTDVPSNSGTYITPNANYIFDIVGESYVVTNVFEHNLGFVPLVPIPNGNEQWNGTSEISSGWRANANFGSVVKIHSQRSIEGWSKPHLVGKHLKSEDEEVLNEKGEIVIVPKNIDSLEFDSDHMITLGTNYEPSPDGPVESPNQPDIDQIRASDPSSLAQYLAIAAKGMSGATSVPASSFGTDSEINPTSGDSIRAHSEEFNNAIYNKVNDHIAAWTTVGEYIYRVLRMEVPDDITPKFKAVPMNSSQSSDIEDTVNLYNSGVIPSNSTVYLDRILTPEQIDQLIDDRALAENISDTQSSFERMIAGLDSVNTTAADESEGVDYGSANSSGE